MSFWGILDGVERTIVNLFPSGIDNDHGNIRNGGNVGDTDRFSGDAVDLGVSRQTTVVSGVTGITGIISAGPFNAGDQVIRRVTTDIANVTNNVLLSGGSNSANRPFSIKQVASMSTFYYKTAVRTGGWHEFSGIFSPAVTVASSGAWSQETDTDVSTVMVTSGVDNAANPTAAIPGELVYRDGSPDPVQDDYQANTSF